MTNSQEIRLMMCITVDEYCNQYPSITKKLPLFDENRTVLSGTIREITTMSTQQKVDRTGGASDKKHLAATLITLVADSARKQTAFAKLSNNLPLLAEVNIPESSFRNFSDTDLRDYSQIIYDRGQSNIDSLAGYGITAESQAALLSAIEAYGAALAKPRLGTTVTRQATQRLEQLFKQANAALEKMDAAVEIVRLTESDFYNGYRTARKLVNTGSGSLTLKGMVTDSTSGEPLKGVTVSFCPECAQDTAATAANGISSIKPEVVLTKVTADKGGFNIKSLPSGVYRVTLSKAGYRDTVVTVAVTPGELSDLNVELTRN